MDEKTRDSFKKLNSRYLELRDFISLMTIYDDTYAKAAQEMNALEPLHECWEDIEVMEELGIAGKELSDAYEGAESALNQYYCGEDFATFEECLVEVRPGVGGDEACDFCMDITLMYLRYAKLKKWKVEECEYDDTSKMGYKSATLKLLGIGCLSHMSLEAGTHRIQRVPLTEQRGRIHTSTVSVAVLPINEAVRRIPIEDKDIVIQVKHARGSGGQAVNKHSSAIRMLHIPTGLVVESDAERSQKQNIDNCKEKLQALIYQQTIAAQQAKEAETRISQVGRSTRSEKFRTYNEPQHRITQHEDGSETFNYEKFFTGTELDEFHYALNKFRKEMGAIYERH